VGVLAVGPGAEGELAEGELPEGELAVGVLEALGTLSGLDTLAELGALVALDELAGTGFDSPAAAVGALDGAAGVLGSALVAASDAGAEVPLLAASPAAGAPRRPDGPNAVGRAGEAEVVRPIPVPPPRPPTPKPPAPPAAPATAPASRAGRPEATAPAPRVGEAPSAGRASASGAISERRGASGSTPAIGPVDRDDAGDVQRAELVRTPIMPCSAASGTGASRGADAPGLGACSPRLSARGAGTRSLAVAIANTVAIPTAATAPPSTHRTAGDRPTPPPDTTERNRPTATPTDKGAARTMPTSSPQRQELRTSRRHSQSGQPVLSPRLQNALAVRDASRIGVASATQSTLLDAEAFVPQVQEGHQVPPRSFPFG
jgi:hypothetical protein